MSIHELPKERWAMANGNESWIHPLTIKNIGIIYDFLLAKTLEADRQGKPKPSFTYKKIAMATGLHARIVQFACAKMAFKKEPYFRIRTGLYRSQAGARVCERVSLRRMLSTDAEKDALREPADRAGKHEPVPR